MQERKAFQVRIPEKLWKFLKKESLKQEKSLNQIIMECLEELKNNKERGVDKK
jgi:predicted HicB family RNase H-like nuclease